MSGAGTSTCGINSWHYKQLLLCVNYSSAAVLLLKSKQFSHLTKNVVFCRLLQKAFLKAMVFMCVTKYEAIFRCLLPKQIAILS